MGSLTISHLTTGASGCNVQGMKQSVVTRIGLSAKDLAGVRKISVETGVPMARLMGDAVRAQLLAPKEKAA